MSPKQRHKPGPKCPCCGAEMAKPAVCCGVCWTRLPHRTQEALHNRDAGWPERWDRFQALIAQGKKPEEIRL